MGAQSPGQVDGHRGGIHGQFPQVERPPTPFGTLAPMPPICTDAPSLAVNKGTAWGGVRERNSGMSLIFIHSFIHAFIHSLIYSCNSGYQDRHRAFFLMRLTGYLVPALDLLQEKGRGFCDGLHQADGAQAMGSGEVAASYP